MGWRGQITELRQHKIRRIFNLILARGGGRKRCSSFLWTNKIVGEWCCRSIKTRTMDGQFGSFTNVKEQEWFYVVHTILILHERFTSLKNDFIEWLFGENTNQTNKRNEIKPNSRISREGFRGPLPSNVFFYTTQIVLVSGCSISLTFFALTLGYYLEF